MTYTRIKNITCKKDGTPYYKVTLRTKWVQHLKSQEQKTSNLTQQEIDVISSFLSGIMTPISTSFLQQQITKWCHYNQLFFIYIFFLQCEAPHIPNRDGIIHSAQHHIFNQKSQLCSATSSDP